MIHLPKTALSVIAMAAVAVAGCSGGSPTPTPITDPSVLIGQVATSAVSVQSLHVKVEIKGKINLSTLMGSSGGLTGNYDVTGTTVEGDIDVARQALDLKLNAPTLFNTTGEAIVVDGVAYYKSSLSGDKFTKSSLGDLTGGLGISVPSALPSIGAMASGQLSDEIAQLRQQLADAGVTATMEPVEQVAGKDSYHVSYGLPLDKINAGLAGAGSAAGGMTLDSAAIDVWVYKDSNLPAKLEVKGSAGTAGNLDVVITLTDYNKSVTISAPPADQIQA
jgi:hypothetical protein